MRIRCAQSCPPSPCPHPPSPPERRLFVQLQVEPHGHRIEHPPSGEAQVQNSLPCGGRTGRGELSE